MAVQLGDRVGAILEAKGERVEFLGYGVYEGVKSIGGEAAGWLAEIGRELGHSNPCIRLDNGDIVWGCECWWGSEERIKQELLKYKEVVTISIRDARKRAWENEKPHEEATS
jgi:hypothetical protein